MNPEPGAPAGLYSGPRGLADLYDEATLASIEAAGSVIANRRRHASVEAGAGTGAGAGGSAGEPQGAVGGTAGALRLACAVTLASLTATGEVLGARRVEPEVAHYVPAPPSDTEPVSVRLVPGAPGASHIVIRPWLMAG